MSRWRHVYVRLTRLTVGIWLVLTTALLALWVASYYGGGYVARTQWSLSATQDQWWTTSAGASHGIIWMRHSSEQTPAFVANFTSGSVPFSNNRTQPVGVLWEWSDRAGDPAFAAWRPAQIFWGLWWSRGSFRLGQRFWSLQLSISLLVAVAVTLLVALVTLLHFLRRPLRRLRAGLCPACGYDIRATRERCPECGTALPQIQ